MLHCTKLEPLIICWLQRANNEAEWIHEVIEHTGGILPLKVGYQMEIVYKN